MRENQIDQRKVGISWIYVHLLVFLLCVFISCPRALAIDQEDRISVEIKAGSLQDAFVQIEEKNDLRFLYSNEDVAGITVKAHNFKNATIGSILNTLLKETSLSWEIQDDVILIKKKTAEQMGGVKILQ